MFPFLFALHSMYLHTYLLYTRNAEPCGYLCSYMVIIIAVALKYRNISVSKKAHIVTSQLNQDTGQITDFNTAFLIDLLFLYLINQVNKLLQTHKFELVELCKSLKASEVKNINLFTIDQIKELGEDDCVLMKLSSRFTWSNYSILKALVSCSSETVKLLEEFESKLDPLLSVTSYPIPCLSSDMIPIDTNTYTILAVRCDKELYQCTLQYTYDVQSMMIEKCDITQHCLQLLAVRSDPTILYWTIPKCVVNLINTNVPLHSEYLYSKGLLEVLVYPDLLLTTGDEVCYGSLAFQCIDTEMVRIFVYIHKYNLHTYIHTHIHTYRHTYVHAYIHSYIHTYIHACMHACIHTITCTYTNIHKCTSARNNSHPLAIF